ncbi:MAG: hypothetical protein ABI779_18205, partial [Acidobacteriota bacterium]
DWHDAKQTQWLTEWLQAFFSSRRGARPHGVTRILRLLRAPGEQWFDGDAAPSLDEETEVWAVEAVLKTYFTEEGPGKAELIASRSLLYVPLEGGA